MIKLATILLAYAMTLTNTQVTVLQYPDTDTQRLGMALDYFAGGKYHEALVLFVKLHGRYMLNPRFTAYMGICYYHEQEYEEACKSLDKALPHLEAFSPGERSVYYHVAAESHFALCQYEQAIPLYEKQLLLCHDNEKGDIFFRLGFCHMFLQHWDNASGYFKSALAYYSQFPRSGLEARILQIKNMIAGCKENESK